MKTTIRLPDGLAAHAQARADWLGLSFNGLVAVALDAYLRQSQPPALSAPSAPPEPLQEPADHGGPVAAPAELSRQQRRALEREAAKGRDK